MKILDYDLSFITLVYNRTRKKTRSFVIYTKPCYNLAMYNYLIDSHCHLHDEEWYSSTAAQACLQEAVSNNVRQLIVIGTDPADSAKAQAFAREHDGVFWTYGIHPEGAEKYTDDVVKMMDVIQEIRCQGQNRDMRRLAVTLGLSESEQGCLDGLVAIGEIGLDYHYDSATHKKQIQLFECMLQLAQSLELPVSLHIREAFTDALPILDNFPKLKGVVHSFTGSKKVLREVLARDFYVGVNGLETYSTLPLPPLEKMLLETDAPFLTPVPFRGTMNQPGYVRYVANDLAVKLGVEEVNLVEQTTKNARQLFQLGDAKLCES